MKSKRRTWSVFLPVLAAVILAPGLTGCRTTGEKQRSEPPAKVEHPAGEHPATQPAHKEHPKSEHPKAEHPKSEHPEHPK